MYLFIRTLKSFALSLLSTCQIRCLWYTLGSQGSRHTSRHTWWTPGNAWFCMGRGCSWGNSKLSGSPLFQNLRSFAISPTQIGPCLPLLGAPRLVPNHSSKVYRTASQRGAHERPLPSERHVPRTESRQRWIWIAMKLPHGYHISLSSWQLLFFFPSKDRAKPLRLV